MKKKFLHFIMVVGLFSGLAIGTFKANPFDGKVVSPMDLLMAYNGFSTASPKIYPHHPQHSDSVDSQLPTWNFYRETLRKGQLPLWNPTNSGGVPGVLNLTSEFYSPFFWPYVLTEKPGYGFYIGVIAKLVVAGTGMFYLLQNFLPWWPSIFGGIVFMLCGFHASWLFVPATSVTAWLPWLLGAVCRFHILGKWTQILAIYIFTLLIVLAGFPSVAAYGLYAAALCGLIFSIALSSHWREASFRFFMPFVAIALAFLTASVPLAALISQLGNIDLSYRAQASTILTVQDFIKFWNPYENDGLNVERTMYVGKLPLALAGVGLVTAIVILIGLKFRKPLINLTRPQIAFSVFSLTLFALSLVISFGLINHDLIRLIPVFSFNPWSRMISVLNLSLALLSAIGLNLIFQQKRVSGKPLNLILSLIGLLACGMAYEDQKNVVRAINGSSSVDWFYPPTPSTKYIKEHSKPFNGVITDTAFLLGGVVNGYGFYEWFGHEFKSNATKRVLEEAVTSPWVTTTAAAFTATSINIGSPYLDLLGIKYLMIDKGHEQALIEKAGPKIEQWNIHNLESKITVFEKKDAAQVNYIESLDSDVSNLSPLQDVDVDMLSPQSIRITVQNPVRKGFLLLPFQYDRHWKAKFNGESLPVSKYKEVFPALKLDRAGVYYYSYEPNFLSAALFLTTIGILGIAIVCYWYLRRYDPPHSLGPQKKEIVAL